MKWALFIGRLAGIKVFIHWTFLILLIWLTFNSIAKGNSVSDTVWTITFYLTLFLCVFLHEMGHSLAAKKYGINTEDITILPIGGLARLERIPSIPSQELWVALAGPLVNVAIAALLAIPVIAGYFNPEEFSVTSINQSNFIPQLLATNVILVLFNMIPAFPMDGGRVLRALLSMKMDRAKATKISATIGQAVAIGFVIYGFFSGNFMLIFIGFFIYIGAQGESGYTRVLSTLEGYTVRNVLMTDFKILQKDEPIGRAVQLLLSGQTKDFLIMDNEQIVGTLNRTEMIKGITAGGDTPIEEFMNRDVKFLNINTSLEDIFPLTQQKNPSLFPVVDENNNLLGVVDVENIMEFLMVRKAVSQT